MAWQAPKTNWAAADGVRDSDFNRIEENIRILYEGTAPFEDVTLFVSPSGSDTTGEGSSSLPYATITKALMMLPRDFNGKYVTINVAAGTYDETVLINGFSGGELHITGAAGAAVTINSMTITACSVRLTQIDVTIAGSPGLVLGTGASLVSSNDITINGGSTGLNVFDNSRAMLGSISISNTTTAVSVYNNSMVFIFQLMCASVGTAITASNGGIVAYGYFSGTVSTAITAVSTGGRVYTGGQAGLL